MHMCVRTGVHARVCTLYVLVILCVYMHEHVRAFERVRVYVCM